MNGARAKVKPIPERPIAYAVANLFLKYNAVTTEKDWYSSAKPIPEKRNKTKPHRDQVQAGSNDPSQSCFQLTTHFNLPTITPMLI